MRVCFLRQENGLRANLLEHEKPGGQSVLSIIRSIRCSLCSLSASWRLLSVLDISYLTPLGSRPTVDVVVTLPRLMSTIGPGEEHLAY
jgi:hypothetical protein